MTSRRPTHLSKSRIMSGMQCEKRLWLEVYRPDLKAELTPAQERVFASGNAVGEEARTRFPGGVLISTPYWDLAGAVRETGEILARTEIPHLYEAAFEADGTHVKVDVLSRERGAAWRLVEVKSTSSLKEEHVTDTAIQLHVAERSGIAVSGCSLMHLNRDCRYPDLSNLFVQEDITDDTQSTLPAVPSIIARMHEVVAQSNEPRVPIGTHCTSPYECPFKEYCWAEVPAHSIFTIPGLRKESKDALVSAGILEASALAGAAASPVPLSEKQQEYVAMVADGLPRINREGIAGLLNDLASPLYFLDFETCADAIPRFDGLGPWQNYPFQYSLHVLKADGTLTHHDYLHETPDDPRASVARALCHDTGPDGTLIAYNASFEKRVIADLAVVAPDHAAELLAMPGRFFDLLVVFRNYYAHPEFLGSNSIKNVLPVLVPDLSYDRLAVRNGEDAQAEWSRAVELPNEMERSFIFDALREYCKLDTLAMVRIHHVLRTLA